MIKTMMLHLEILTKRPAHSILWNITDAYVCTDMFGPNGISESSQPERDCQRIVIFEQLIVCDRGQRSTSNSQCGWNCCLELFEATSSSLPNNVFFH